MKKAAAFILLLCHINFSMFLPQMPEKDSYDASGAQVEDVNSLAEYAGVLLGFDNTSDDEDNDDGGNINLEQDGNYLHPHINSSLALHGVYRLINTSFAEYLIHQPNAPAYDIIAPPPEA